MICASTTGGVILLLARQARSEQLGYNVSARCFHKAAKRENQVVTQLPRPITEGASRTKAQVFVKCAWLTARTAFFVSKNMTWPTCLFYCQQRRDARRFLDTQRQSDTESNTETRTHRHRETKTKTLTQTVTYSACVDQRNPNPALEV